MPHTLLNNKNNNKTRKDNIRSINFSILVFKKTTIKIKNQKSQCGKKRVFSNKHVKEDGENQSIDRYLSVGEFKSHRLILFKTTLTPSRVRIAAIGMITKKANSSNGISKGP